MTRNTLVRPTLFRPELFMLRGNDFMSEKLYYCMILGLREKPGVHTGNLTTRAIPVFAAVMKNTDLQFSSEQSRELELCRPG